ncbi:hypothetical protein RHGRI_028388 [Rhododendron griersonianum]|uniref:Uncharacterized protein n=1 Tax=Rhododendron griersonianum TaxID=479676 RepID=A0AAV6ILA5_9ERIC|nr:hypothetical protein RHGRI_028388 [Rhododendron griersonianum]
MAVTLAVTLAETTEPRTKEEILKKTEEKKEQSVAFYELFMFADKYDWFLMVFGTMGAIVHGSSLPVFFFLFGEMINGFGKNQSDFNAMMHEVSKCALRFVYLGVTVCISSYAEIACWMYTGERQVGTWRKKYLEAVLKQDVGFFDTDARTGDIVLSVATDTVLVQDAISEKVGNFIHRISTFVAGLVVGFVLVWRLALLSVAVIPGIALAGGLYAYILTSLTSKSRESYANASIIAEQALNSYSDAIQHTLRLGYKAGMAKGLGLGCTHGMIFISWALVFWYASLFIREGLTDGGKAFTAILTAVVGGMSLAQSLSNLGAFSKGKAAGYKLMKMIKQRPTIIQDPSNGKCLAEFSGKIEFKDVTFSYPSRPDVIVLRDFSVSFPAGKTTAVVGGSGSGKSTIVSLIERFYDPNQGQILLDNVDIKTLQLRWLRDQIGLVNQEPALFATTIIENILYANPDAATIEVEAAASAANAHNFITLLPNGYNTQVGERGVQLSGGQKQRIAIARAMLKNPKILLLDEATSALDAGSESIVQEALDHLMVGRTSLVVAHRFSTIRNVDSIAVIQHGQVVETGTHDELISKSGAFASLCRFQETMGNHDYPNPSTRHTCSPQLSHSLSTKSISHHSSSLSYSYDSGADGRIEMVSILSNVKTEKKNPAPHGYFCRLLKLNAPEWPYSIMGAVGSILYGFVNPTISVVLSSLIEVFYYRNHASMERKTKEYVIIFLGTGLYAVVAYFIQHYFFNIMGENLGTRVRRMMFAAILMNEVGWYDEEEHNSSIVAACLATDAADVKSTISERISFILQNMTSLLTSFIVGFVVEWRVSLLTLATFPLLVLAYFAQLIRKGVSTFSKVIQVIVILVMAATTVADTLSLAPKIIGGRQAMGSIFSIMDRSTKIDADDPDAEPVDSVHGEIELCHVDFSYPSRPDVLVFKDFNLKIQAGQSQALVGESGSRKSSVIALIERFYDPSAGTVMIDGKDIKRLNLKSLRLKIGLVSQEPALFAATIFDNIAYGKDGATEAEVTEAARVANVHAFISRLPEGYKTTVGERGVQISGGQKQRIAIARAVLKDSAILLLDEATSAVDAESESVLQEALERLMRGRTTVLIAHWLSTISGVDSIAVIQDGRIVEQESGVGEKKKKKRDLGGYGGLRDREVGIGLVFTAAMAETTEPRTKEEILKRTDEEKQQSVAFYELFMFADKYDWFLMVFGTMGAIVHGSSMPVFLFLFGEVLNGFGQNQSDFNAMMHEVSKCALRFVYLGVTVCISSYAEIACWMYTGERQVGTLRKKYLEAVLKQDVGFFDTDARTGDIVLSVATDTVLVQDAISEKVGNFIHYISTFVAGLVVGFVLAWRLALLSVAVIPGIALAGGLYAYILTSLTSKSSESYANASIIAEQAIAQIRTVYSYVGESKALNSYSDAIQHTLKLGYKAGMAKGLGLGCTYGMIFMSWALVFWYASLFIREGLTDGGKAFTTILSAVVGGMSLAQSLSNLGAFSKGKAAGYKLMKMIRQRPTIIQDPSNGKCLAEFTGKIEFEDVTFSYPSRPDVIILRDFTISFPAGKTTAVVGGSGSGKSTIVSLIERFYDPNQGQILLDNVDIKTLQLRWLRDQIGLVNQEPALFATTIAENILYANPDATLIEVEAAASAANAHKFITLLPNGYNTQVGERGVQLSGGQKQRIAIARAMLKNPKILLLDEATSALDAGSESIVQEALEHLMVGRTSLVVAHRFSTIRNVDSIAVIQQGQVVETGTHGELISKSGAFASLCRFQEMTGNHDYPNPSTRHTCSPQLSHSLATKSISHHSSSLSFSYNSGANGRIEMVSNVKTERKSPTPQGYFCRLLKLNAPEWPYSIMGAVGSILCGFVSPTISIALSSMVGVFYYSNHASMERKTKEYVILFLGTGLYTVVAYIIQHYFFNIMGENLATRVRRMMLAAILKNEVGWYDEEEHNSSLVAACLATDAADVKSTISERISFILQNMTSLLTSFIVAFIVDWRVSLLTLATFPLLVLAYLAQQLSLKGFAGDIAKTHAKTSMIAGEGVSNIRTVAAFNAQDKILSLFCHELRVPQLRSLSRSQMSGILFGLSQLTLYCSNALFFWFGAQLIRKGVSTFSEVIQVIVILLMAAITVADTLSLAPKIIGGSRAMESIFSIMDRSTKIDADDPDAEPVDSVHGEIELCHVDFSYPSRPDVLVFNDFNLKIQAGQSQALVGESGSGKSSIIALIERFYDPSAGTVMIDGKDIKRLNLKSLRLKIGLVSQEPALFAATIFDNIAYGKDGATEAEVIEAARVANVHAFISGLPEGYKTPVGERGVQISGGQKQRIAIARAVLKDPAILLLDEATSAVDAESESVLQEALERLMRGRTTVLVAHRLSTIRGVDSIAVIQDGRIVEQGSHSELVSRHEGAYCKLLELQRHHI